MIVLHVNDDLSARLEQRAASAKMSVETYTHELLKQAIEEEDDLDLAIEEHRLGGPTFSTDEVRRELGLEK